MTGFAQPLRLSAFACLVAASFTVAVSAQTWQATPLEGEALLRVPKDLADDAGSSFHVADKAPRVDFVRMSGLPDKGKGTLWSTWGDGCLASNGRYYTSIGDHLGRDATSHIYEYDPEKRRLRRVVDIAEAIGQKPGQYGHGKVHSGIHEGPGGGLWFSTYWGKHREVDAAFGPEYQGSIVMRYDPASGNVENLGAIVPRQGLPASHFVRSQNVLCFYAVYDNDLVVYDVVKRKRVFLGGKDVIAGNRELMHDAKGSVYFTGHDKKLHRYDPAANAVVATKASVAALDAGSKKKSGFTLRAATNKPTPGGTIYAMTSSGRLFAFDPAKESIRDLGPNFLDGMYTAVVVADAAGESLYFCPGAHGGGHKVGGPIVRYDVESGRRTVVAFLEDILKERFDYQLGGTYNLQIDADVKRLFITFNGAPIDASKKSKVVTFGEPCVVVVHLP